MSNESDQPPAENHAREQQAPAGVQPTVAVAAPKMALRYRNRLVEFFFRLFTERPLGAFGAIICLLLLLTGIFADVIAPTTWAGTCLPGSSTGRSSR